MSIDARVHAQAIAFGGEFYRLEGLPPRMRGSKGIVAAWMPVLCQNHMLKALRNAVDERNNLIAARHRKCAFRTKVVLDGSRTIAPKVSVQAIGSACAMWILSLGKICSPWPILSSLRQTYIL